MTPVTPPTPKPPVAAVRVDGPQAAAHTPPRLLPSGTLAVLLAALPFALAALALLLSGRSIDLAGDQALIGLDTGDAAEFSQLLGPYSRYGWTHPGPLWFYLLAGPYVLLGRTGSALSAAVLLGQALAAAALVAAVAGRRPPWRMPLAALVVVVYLLRVPTESFIALWNPAVLALPLAALILLAARAAAGSLPALAGAAFAGTFLVQTHLGTAPVVASVALVLVAIISVRLSRWARHGSRDHATFPVRAHSRAGAVVAVTAIAATVVAWVPPVLQQLRGDGSGGPGNIRLLVEFFTDPGGGALTLREGLTVICRLIAVPITGAPPPGELVAAPLTGDAQQVAYVFVGCCFALVIAGWATRAVQGAWTGLLCAVALLAAAQAVTAVRGPVYTYLLEWSFALPLALAVGWCDVLARLALPRLIGPRQDIAWRVGWGLVTVAAVVSMLAGIRAARAPTQSDSPGAASLAAAMEPVVRADLPARIGPDLVLDINRDGDWPLAAGLALWLREDAGREVLVPARLTGMFGADRGVGTAGEALPVLTVVPAGQPGPEGAQSVAAGRTEYGRVELWLTPSAVRDR